MATGEFRVKQIAAGTNNGSVSGPKTDTGATDVISTEELDQLVVEVTGITTGTVQVQVSLDGSTWTDEGSALTADGRVVVSGLAGQVRGNITVATGVAIVLKAGGRVQQPYG